MIAFTMVLACGSAETPAATPPVAAAPAASADWKHFGEPFAVQDAVAASAVLADPGAHATGKVHLKGAELTEVCQRMGCWAVVQDDQGHAMRVTMKDHAFGIDKDTVGRKCEVEGELVKKAVDPEKLAHYASEGAKHAPEAGKAESWELVATAVAIERGPGG